MIPDEAVEAALRAWAVRGGLSPKGIVRNILEAAAPHMLAAAWEEGPKRRANGPL